MRLFYRACVWVHWDCFVLHVHWSFSFSPYHSDNFRLLILTVLCILTKLVALCFNEIRKYARADSIMLIFVASPCKNGAGCNPDPSKPLCTCARGFSGTQCQTPVCSSSCLNGGSCTINQGRPQCTCTRGYSGTRCQTSVCQSACLNGGTCSISRQGRPQCRCPAGYSGSRCETNRCSGQYEAH